MTEGEPRDLLDRGLRAQLAHLHAAFGAGVSRVGWKICVNEPATQKRFGIDAPFVGHLRGDRVLGSGDVYTPPPGAILVAEAEVAIVLDDALGIGALCPAIELANYDGATPSLDHVAEHGSYHACAIFGAPRAPDSLPLIHATCPRLLRNGEPTGDADPTLVPTDLNEVVQHASRSLEPYGERLEPGDRILAGSYVAPARVAPGDEIQVDFAGLGSVDVRIAA